MMNTSSQPIAGKPRADTERSRPEASKSSVGAGDGDEDGRGVSAKTPQVPQLLRQFSAVSLKEHRLGSPATAPHVCSSFPSYVYQSPESTQPSATGLPVGSASSSN